MPAVRPQMPPPGARSTPTLVSAKELPTPASWSKSSPPWTSLALAGWPTFRYERGCPILSEAKGGKYEVCLEVLPSTVKLLDGMRALTHSSHWQDSRKYLAGHFSPPDKIEVDTSSGSLRRA